MRFRFIDIQIASASLAVWPQITFELCVQLHRHQTRWWQASMSFVSQEPMTVWHWHVRSHFWLPAVSWHIRDQQKVEPATTSTGTQLPTKKKTKTVKTSVVFKQVFLKRVTCTLCNNTFDSLDEAQEVIHPYCGISQSFVETNTYRRGFQGRINSGLLIITVGRADCLVVGDKLPQ